MPEWLFLTSSLSAPASTLLASGGVIIAAGIAFWNGEKTRQEEREKWVGAKQQDAVRSLRDRYFHITELLSENSSYAQREAAVYSLVALSDDWASFYSDDTEAAIREQQTCLNVIVGQLRDQLPNKDNHERSHERSELTVFKRRVQNVIAQRYRPSGESKQGGWTHLDLDLSYCHLYEPNFTDCTFDGRLALNSTNVVNPATFERVKFTRFVDFRDASFGDHANFQGASFGDHANFQGASFGDHANFRDASFDDHAFFQGASFGDNANFWDASFGDHAFFQGASFGDNANFWDASFDDHADFFNASFGDHANFQGASFGDHANFQGASFGDNADFQGAAFGSGANFRGAKFKKAASFNGPSQFAQQPNFNKTQFIIRPTLTDSSNPLEFFAGATFLDEK